MNTWSIEEFIERGRGLRNMVDDVPDGMFITCASYEPRTLTAPHLLDGSYRARYGIVYEIQETPAGAPCSAAASHSADLQRHLREHCDYVQTVPLTRLDPTKQFRALEESVRSHEGSQGDPGGSIRTITVDVTTMIREQLLILMDLLWTYHPGVQIRVIYVRPAAYGSWLSRGILEVRSVVGFPGLQLPMNPSILVVLSGYEPERVTRLIEEYEPSKVLLGIGGRGDYKKRAIEEQRLTLARQEVIPFEFPTDSIQGCHDALERAIAPYLGHSNLTLAPMSNKLTTLAAYLTAKRHPEIQIAYCVPAEYNADDYSDLPSAITIEMLPLPSTA